MNKVAVVVIALLLALYVAVIDHGDNVRLDRSSQGIPATFLQ